MVRRTAIQAVLAALALSAPVACSDSSSDKAGPTATVVTEPAPTTTTDPYAVPATIDAAYVNRVLAGLDAAVGDVTRLVVRTRTITQEAYDRLKAIYAEPDFMQIRLDGYEHDMRDDFRSYKSPPGNRHSTVSRLISARPACIFVQVSRNYTAVGVDPLAELQTQWVGLTLLDRTRDPNGYNPTPWGYTYDGFQADRSQPADPCAS